MKKYLSFLLAFALTLTFSLSAAPSAEAASPEGDAPVWLYIPSINLFSYVEGVGVNDKGDMDVPSGRTDNVGWYKYGVLPASEGSAVIAAHNTAAFKNLHQVEPGEDIYVITRSGKLLKFTATKAVTHSMETLTPEQLFEKTEAKQMNLITCAGTLLGNGEATHRLIVSAELASDGTYITSTVRA